MSERMIELQRARLLNVGKGAKPPGAATAAPNGHFAGGAAGATGTTAIPLNPQQAAVARAQSEDELLQKFLQKLENRDDSRAESLSGPTVPTSLSRRILQRQGAGYLDPSVGAVVSAAADRFLATVLQQSVVCRDQRLKGAEQAKEAAKHRKRHLEHYKADRDDRDRRKAEKELRREKDNLAAIEAAETLTKEKAAAAAGASKDDGYATKSKKKKALTLGINGNKRKRDEEQEEDDDSYDSIDEEEEYYQSHYGNGVVAAVDDDGDDDDDDMLILRDIVEPLQAWEFCLAGKKGLISSEPEEDDEEEEMDNMVDGEVIVTSVAPETNSNGAMHGATSETAASQDNTRKGPPASPALPAHNHTKPV